MKTEEMKVADLIPYERNAKKHDDRQISNVMESIRQFGFAQPIVVDENNVVIIGHCRLIAAKRLGLRKVPVLKMQLDEEQAQKLRLLDNKLNESDWDIELLTEDIPELDWEGFDVDWNLPEFDDVEIEEEEDLFEDIEKQEKHYGVPYQGNKSRIADIIINVLPKGKRLVDLFGGGGAITHCALLSGKWPFQMYNDINPMITALFMDAVNGKYHDERRVITREDFETLKDSDPYVKYIWSFGNNGSTYLWGKDIEEIKCAACHAIMDETTQDRRLAYVHFIKLLKERKCSTLNRLQSVEHLQGLVLLEALQRLEVSNIDYHDYRYKDGDVVYCDVPYEQKDKTSCDDYGVNFDSIAFYEWAKAQNYQIFFSSYEISDDNFYKIKIKKVMRLMGATSNSGTDTEYLYSNRPIEYGGINNG